MYNYIITLKNGAGYILEQVEIKAEDGTKALLQYIKENKPIIEDGDKITIEETNILTL